MTTSSQTYIYPKIKAVQVELLMHTCQWEVPCEKIVLSGFEGLLYSLASR